MYPILSYQTIATLTPVYEYSIILHIHEGTEGSRIRIVSETYNLIVVKCQTVATLAPV